jgi:hypothetical protein
MSSGKLVTSSPINIFLLIVLPVILLLLLNFLTNRVWGEGTIMSYVTQGVAFLFVWFPIMWRYVVFEDIAMMWGKPDEYFKKFGDEGVISEYQFSRKLFYAAIVVFIPLFIITQFELYPFHKDSDLYLITSSIEEALFLPLFVSGPRLGMDLKKDFDYYLARAYFRIGSGKNELEEFKYLTLMLNTYNKFLERSLKLKIKDIMRIYSIFISASIEQKIKIRKSIGKALEKDELELARNLAELSSLQDKEQFLIREPAILNQQFKDILTIIIPAIISIVGFIITISPLIMGLFGSQPSS